MWAGPPSPLRGVEARVIAIDSLVRTLRSDIVSAQKENLFGEKRPELPYRSPASRGTALAPLSYLREPVAGLHRAVPSTSLDKPLFSCDRDANTREIYVSMMRFGDFCSDSLRVRRLELAGSRMHRHQFAQDQPQWKSLQDRVAKVRL